MDKTIKNIQIGLKGQRHMIKALEAEDEELNQQIRQHDNLCTDTNIMVFGMLHNYTSKELKQETTKFNAIVDIHNALEAPRTRHHSVVGVQE